MNPVARCTQYLALRASLRFIAAAVRCSADVSPLLEELAQDQSERADQRRVSAKCAQLNIEWAQRINHHPARDDFAQALQQHVPREGQPPTQDDCSPYVMWFHKLGDKDVLVGQLIHKVIMELGFEPYAAINLTGPSLQLHFRRATP